MREEFWQARIERVQECFAAGLSQGETAEYLGITTNTVRTYIKRATLVAPSSSSANINAVKDCASRGLTRAEAAAETGLSIHTVGMYGREYAIPFRHASAVVHDPRADDMAAMYKGGKTLEEIGSVYGITRERVRQLIKKYHGLRGNDGGAMVKAEIRRAKARVRQNVKYLRKYGCTFDQWQKMVAEGRKMRSDGRGRYQSPTYAFSAQRQNARRRGIDWDLTLIEWWTIWTTSGKWEQRGRGRGYMMCRFGDIGAYAAGNVYIATGVHNAKVQLNNPYRVNHPDHASVVKKLCHRAGASGSGNGRRVHMGLPKGVTIKSGRFIAQASIGGKKRYLGCFGTPEEAHAAFLRAKSRLAENGRAA